MHCESGDILVRDVDLADPASGDILVTPATGAYGYAMANNYNGVRGRRSCSAATATRPWRCGARPTTDLVSRDV